MIVIQYNVSEGGQNLPLSNVCLFGIRIFQADDFKEPANTEALKTW